MIAFASDYRPPEQSSYSRQMAIQPDPNPDVPSTISMEIPKSLEVVDIPVTNARNTKEEEIRTLLNNAAKETYGQGQQAELIYEGDVLSAIRVWYASRDFHVRCVNIARYISVPRGYVRPPNPEAEAA